MRRDGRADRKLTALWPDIDHAETIILIELANALTKSGPTLDAETSLIKTDTLFGSSRAQT